MSEAKDRSRTWWTRPGLDVRGGRLFVAGRDGETLAREHGTPLYAHDSFVLPNKRARSVRRSIARGSTAGSASP